MPNPIPASIRRLTEQPIKGKGDWIRRTRRARDLLIERHGYKASEFWEVGKGDSPTLDMCSLYPPRFGLSRWFGKLRRRDWVEHFPCGLVLHNSGSDYWGEAGDDGDPILILAEVEHWGSLTDAELHALCGDAQEAAA
ncbi:hypothetical protein PARHAE_00779 [Paracoccus haematequi]|uniref:Uncharacterized protein n=1 Tax=Paracoccus haematequi TaxID=2491866 RepID=A0A3S5D3V3_9RHOB|nr:hypothetical protein [Paracoccus haematequi]VDS07602.1 hypothetical protein PARHAE_00779 [Paracoccus haematequi]